MRKTVVILATLLLPLATLTAQECHIGALKCEHLTAPLGIDEPTPRLQWKMDDARQGAKQRAYRIVVDTDSLALANGKAAMWDSGRQNDNRILVNYKGRALKPQTRYYWRVTAWDKDGVEVHAPITYFETGKMGMKNWKGAWISDHHDIDYKPAPYFRKEFCVGKKVKQARAYIAAAGLYELSINGRKVGDHRLDPTYTRFDRRNLYVTHDVTNYLQAGSNAIGVILGNGWYNHQSLGVWDFHDAPWRARPAFCIDLQITYTDGSEEAIVSENDWKTASGPIILNYFYTAEHYDARLEMEGWDRPDFDDSHWGGIRYRSTPSQQISSQQMAPIRNVTEYPTQSMHKFDDQTYVFDMGQNMAGTTQVRIKGEEGTLVKIKHGERLDDRGRVDLSNIDVYYRGDRELAPFQTDLLYLSGKKEDEFMARFNYKGFRYVEITSDRPLELTPESITAWFMHSDVEPTGHISASTELINGLWRATNNAYLSNLMGYPTDCPQREKNGWTGDGHLAIETALYNYDAITVYEKWMADHRDEQQPNGVLPDIIPTGGWGYGTANGLDWTSTIAIIPWEIYLFYGDSKLLRDCYANLKSYVDYVTRISRGGLTTFGRGDWVPVSVPSNLELTSSTYFYVDASILSQAAALFGYAEDQQKYAALAAKIRTAINDKYLDREKGIYASGTQTELSVPLHWGVAPEELKAKVAANLDRKVAAANYHLDVGVLGAKALLNALNDNGYQQSAYRVAVQNTYPSWGWWVVNGATTLLENWDLKATRDISDNHMMFGEIGGWFFKGPGGIKPDPQKPGFQNVLLTPYFPEGLDRFEASHESPYGTIVSKWVRRRNKITYTVVIPANSTATLQLPANVKDARRVELDAGTYRFDLVAK
ncbi:MAG: family 78 glycoside hydrolase catalytic domain [Alistipes sp.]